MISGENWAAPSAADPYTGTGATGIRPRGAFEHEACRGERFASFAPGDKSDRRAGSRKSATEVATDGAGTDDENARWRGIM